MKKNFIITLLVSALSVLPCLATDFAELQQPQEAVENNMAECEALAGIWKMPNNFTKLVFTNSYNEETRAETRGDITFDREGGCFVEFYVEEQGKPVGGVTLTYVVTITGKGKYIAKDGNLTLMIFPKDLEYEVNYDSNVLDSSELEKFKDYAFVSMNNLKRNIQNNFYSITKNDWVWKNEKYEINGKQLKIAGKTLKLRKKLKK